MASWLNVLETAATAAALLFAGLVAFQTLPPGPATAAALAAVLQAVPRLARVWAGQA